MGNIFDVEVIECAGNPPYYKLRYCKKIKDGVISRRRVVYYSGELSRGRRDPELTIEIEKAISRYKIKNKL